MKISPHARSFWAAAAISALVLSGCSQTGDSSGSANSGDASHGANGAGLPPVGYEAVDVGDLREGGTLTFPLAQWPANFNYNHADGALVDLKRVLLAQNWGGPVMITPDGTWERDANYAESVELTDEDPQVIQVKLNPDARWENGDPITVEDYQANFAALNGSNEQYQPASTAVWEDIEKVDQGADEFDLTMTFRKQNAEWPAILLGQLLPASIASDAEAFNSGYVDKMPPATGPFKVASMDSTGGVITMERNPQWWGDQPKLDTVVFKVVSQASQAQAYANKEIDVVDIGADGDSYQTARGRSDGQVLKSDGTQYTHLTLNATKGPLAQAQVRQAIGHAVNRELLMQTSLGPVEVKPELVNNNIYLPGQKGYQDNTEGALALDQEAAKTILDDAGWAMEGDVRSKDGNPLSLDITVPADTQTNAQRAQQVQRDLNAVGFQVEVKTVPRDKYFSDYVIPKNFELVTFTWQGTPFPVTSAANIFYPADSAQNYFGISSDEIGKYVNEATAEFDDSQRIKLVTELDKAIWDLRVMVPFGATPYIWGVTEGLENIGPAQFLDLDYTEVGFRK